MVYESIIFDMVSSIELERPRITLILPHWELGIVLGTLKKAPHESLSSGTYIQDSFSSYRFGRKV